MEELYSTYIAISRTSNCTFHTIPRGFAEPSRPSSARPSSSQMLSLLFSPSGLVAAPAAASRSVVAARSPLRSFSMVEADDNRGAANMDFVEGAADKLAAIDTSTKRGEMSLESNKIDLMKQQLDFEKTDLFKGVSETIAGLEEKGLVYSTEMGYVATRAVKAKKVKK